MLLALLPALLCCQADPGVAERAIAFTHVTLIDVTEASPRRDMTVLVRGERIAEIGQAQELEVPDGARVVEAAGKFMIPGLWDMHVHPARDTDIDYLSLLIANGVTGIRDMGGDFGEIERWRAEIAEGSRVGPRMVAPGRRIDGPGPLDPNSIRVSNSSEARATVRARKERGVDFIKVYSMVPHEAFLALADEARRQGIDIAGHVPFEVSAGEASDAGMKSIEHLLGVLVGCSSRELEIMGEIEAAVQKSGMPGFYAAEILAQADAADTYDEAKAAALFPRFVLNRTYQMPSLVGWKTLQEFDAENLPQRDIFKYVPRTRRQQWAAELTGYLQMLPERVLSARQRLFGRQLELVADMNRAGVPFIAGTDTAAAYTVPGFALHDELGVMVEAGFTPMQALRAATYRPAEYLGQLDSLGTIEVGKLADLVLLEANPLDEIGNTRTISAVVANGRLLERPELDGLLAKVEAEAALGD